jgi:hypothetical protein
VSYYSGVNIRPKFLRRVSIFFICGLLLIAVVYVYPHINLPQRPRLNCPLLAQIEPLSKAPVQATDSLELITFDGKPRTPYTVRLYGDGRVERDTVIYLAGFPFGCPLHEIDRHLRIPAAQADALISKARDGGFCRLCELYQATHPSSDGTADQLTLTFHGKINRVANVSGNPPPLFAELANSLSTIAPIPDYATTTRPSQARMLECHAFEESQIGTMTHRSDKH